MNLLPTTSTNCAHSTYDSDTVHLSAERQEDKIPDRKPAEI